jgi:hypothetical protein
MKNEIILYRPNELAEHIEVRLDEENETFWLTQEQIAQIFDRDRTVISKHSKNIFKNQELDEKVVSAFFAHTTQHGAVIGKTQSKNVKYYNLDVILSVGYRVNSQKGTQFRVWANRVLKEYLLKGYAVNNRMNRLEDNLEHIKNKVDQIELQVNSQLIPTQGIFFDGQIYDAYELMSKIIRIAKKEIILIDNYIDETVLTQLSKRNENVEAIIYTKTISRVLQLDLEIHNSQYPPIQILELRDSQDRFLIIDRKELYHIGASLKDLGKKCLPAGQAGFAFSKLDEKMLAFVLKRLVEE